MSQNSPMGLSLPTLITIIVTVGSVIATAAVAYYRIDEADEKMSNQQEQIESIQRQNTDANMRLIRMEEAMHRIQNDVDDIKRLLLRRSTAPVAADGR